MTEQPRHRPLSGSHRATKAQHDRPDRKSLGANLTNQCHTPTGERQKRLLADLQPSNDVEIPLRSDSLEIIQELAPTAHHHEQTAATGKILGMLLEVIREM